MNILSTHLVSAFNNLKVWWNPAGLLAVTPPSEWKLQSFYIGFISLCFLVALILIPTKLHKELKTRINTLLWTTILVGLLLYAFRVQGLPILGMDFWRFLQEIVTVLWAAYIFIYFKKHHPKLLLKEQVENYKSKYLPHSKK